ncbi:MAG: Anaerobic nitric oxide reductase transcription regulator NorR [Desulfovibrio sp.]
MNGKIALMVSNVEMKAQAERLFAGSGPGCEVSVRMIDVMRLADDCKRLVDEGFDAVMARGGTYQDFKQLLIGRMPVVELRIQLADILLALKTAVAEYRKIYLVLHEGTYFEPEECRRILDIPFEYKTYGNVASLQELLASLPVEDGSVVVGSGACSDIAMRNGLNSVSISTQNSTLMTVFTYAQSMIGQTVMEKRRINLLQSILQAVDDGVVVMDNAGTIKHFNRKSGALFGVNPLEMIGRNIHDVIPGFSPAKLKRDTIVTANEKTFVLNATPFAIYGDEEQLVVTVSDVTKLQELEKSVRFKLASKGLVAKYSFTDILTADPGMKRVIRHAESVAKLDASVIIYGASGTGKELFAQGIHNASLRCSGPFVAINCTALTESLLESELFGYVGGAFTGARKEGKTGLFELAHGGTVFLDEVNSMPLPLQAKILRVIEQREIMRVGSDYVIPLDVRIISASNKPLVEAINAGFFREDLYYRLNQFELTIPPISARKRDILLLFKHFLAREKGVKPSEVPLSPEFEKALLEYDWRGNVREIRSAALRYHVYGDDGMGGDVLPEPKDANALITDDMRIDLAELGNAIEAQVIDILLRKNMKKTDIAKLLGISRQALYKKLEKGGG